jgi:phthalate 4,5-dioxygenase oxygenase subunit
MLTPDENERITRIGPGTPMGAVFRRYWLPALLSSEVPEPDGPPVRVRLLGEDLVAFRDSSGAVGLVAAFCPHRRAPMFFGRNEERGLRCVYHGWKFDAAGSCVDMPSEPPDSLFKTKVAIAAYPTWEGAGLVWAYLGPPEHRPPPPDSELLRAPATHRHVSKTFEDCNYLQALEGGFDSAHVTILHNQNIGDGSFLRSFASTVPRIDVERTGYGFCYSAIRNRPDRQMVRVYHYVMPMTQIRGQNIAFDPEILTINGHYWVPVDDTHTATYNWMYSDDPAVPLTPAFVDAAEHEIGRGPEDVDPLRPFHLKANAANDFLIDRELQKRTFTGIPGINTQDIAVQVGMGPVVDRSKEHLGTTDRAIIVLRQLLLEAADTVAAGAAPRGVDPHAYARVRAGSHDVPLGADWHEALREQLLARF